MAKKIAPKVSELAKEFAVMYRAKQSLKADLDNLNEMMEKKEEQILTVYAEQGIASLRVDLEDGTVNVGVKRQLWAKPKDGDYKACFPALKKVGLADIIQPTFNIRTLSAWVRERLDSGLILPKYFTNVIEVAEKPRVSVTKAAKPKKRLED